MKKLVSDMNERERARFIQKLRAIQDRIDDSIKALQNKEDSALFANILVLSLMAPSTLAEMTEVLRHAVSVDIPEGYDSGGGCVGHEGHL